MRSLRSRLLVTVIGTTLLVYVLSAFGLYEYLELKEETTLHNNLSQHWELVAGLIEEEDGGKRLELELDQLKTGKFVERYSGRYYVVQVDGQAPILSLSLGGVLPGFATKNNVKPTFEAIGPEHEELLVMSRDYYFAKRSIRVTVAESREELKRWLEDIRLALFMGLPLLLIVLGFILGIVIRSALKPLEKLVADLEVFDFYHQTELTQSPVGTVLEISKLSTAFNQLLRRFQKIRASEEQLLVDVSHQLKTPLTVILSTCDIILRRDRDTPKYKDALQQIQETGQGMRTLINRLLSAAHLSSENRQMEDFESCDLSELAKASVAKTQFLAQQKDIELHASGNRQIHIDGNPERIEELLLILIENAVLYSPKQTKIEVNVYQRAQQAVLTVEDQGPGIPADEIPLIFQRFFRGNNNESIPGTGLGLALAEQIVQLHQGQIHVTSHPEKGTCFECAFPLMTPS